MRGEVRRMVIDPKTNYIMGVRMNGKMPLPTFHNFFRICECEACKETLAVSHVSFEGAEAATTKVLCPECLESILIPSRAVGHA